MEATDAVGESAPLLPLRMVVEWSYCPRLFHYMHVEGLMEANSHVWRGRQSHARTDKPGRSQARRAVEPSPGEAEGPPAAWEAARAVSLEAPALGLVAKLDRVLLRDEDGVAVPVELKSGAGPDDDHSAVTLCEGAWDSDAVHVALQVLMLREAGHAAPRGELWYQASRRRAVVELTPKLEAAAHRAVAEARAAQRSVTRPAPLEDSPKCRGCSFAEVCMPDESVALRGVTPVDQGLDDDEAPETLVPTRALARRRLVAAQVEGRSLTVSSAGASVRKEGEALVIVPPPWMEGARPQRVALEQVDALSLWGNVQASTQALMACLEYGIPVSLHAATGRLLGCVSTGLGNNVQLRMRQHAAASDPDAALDLARAFVRGKLRNQRVFLRRHGALDADAANQWASLLAGIDEAPEANALRGIEGRAAALYFPRLSALLEARGGEAFRLDGRSRRPPRDPSNAMLSFGYAVLARECAEVLRRVGFDPMRGFLHGVGWGRPALALDLMEEFRTLVVDSTVLRVVAERRVSADDFHQELQGVAMKPGARKALLQALDQRREEEITHPVFGYKVSYRRALELQARVLARVLDGEAARYVALTTR